MVAKKHVKKGAVLGSLLRNGFVVLLIVLVLLLVFREVVLTQAVRLAAARMTGLTVEVKKLKVGLFKPVLDIGGLKVLNPAGFPDRLMLDVPEIYVRYLPFEVLKGKILLEEVRLNIREVMVIRTKDGKSNVDSLKGMASAKKERPIAEPSKKKATEVKAPVLKMGLLKLDIGKVTLKDYSTDPATVKTQDLNIHKEFRDIDDPANLMRLIVMQSVVKANLAGFTGVHVDALKGSVKSFLGSGADLVQGTTTMAVETTKAAVGSTKEMLKGLGGLFSPRKEE